MKSTTCITVSLFKTNEKIYSNVYLVIEIYQA